MIGIEARDFVLTQMALKDADGQYKVMKLSIDLAIDLLKLSPNEIGKFADLLLDKGLSALTEHGMYGYKISIDRLKDGYNVEFIK